MKRLLVLVMCVFGSISLAATGIVNATVSVSATEGLQNQAVTKEEARKAALVRVPGEVEDEWDDEDEDEKVIGYVFQIRKADKKLFEVTVSVATGKVTNVEEIEEEEDEDPSVR